MVTATPPPVAGTARGKRTMLAFLAWRNVWRNPVRSGLTASAIVAGLVMMIVSAAFNEGMVRRMAVTATELNLGHLQVHREGYIEHQDLYALLPWGLVHHLARTTGHAYAPRLYAAGLASSGDFSTGVLLKGVDPALEPKVTTLNRHVREGAFSLGRAPAPAGREPAFPVYQVVVGAQLAKTLRVGPGSEMVLITQAADGSIGNGLFQVAGVLRPLEGTLDRLGVLLSLEAFQSLMAVTGGVHELAVAAPDLRALQGDKALIEAAVNSWPGPLPDGENGPVVVRTWEEIQPTIADMLGLSNVVVVVITIIIFALVSLGLLNTVFMSIHERRRELGMLRALGMGRLRMVAMVLMESFFLAISAGMLGAVLGVAWALHLQRVGVDFTPLLPDGMDWAGVTIELEFKAFLNPNHVWISVVVMLATTMLATLLPAWRAVRLRPAAAVHD